MKTTVYYHYPCPDGWIAAVAAWLRLGWSATYVGWEAGEYAAALATQTALGDPDPPETVYFLDVCPPVGTLKAFLERGQSVVILDHHETALRQLPALRDLEKSTGRLVASIDTNRSGAWLTWAFFRPEEAPPALVRYADDRDRWRFELPHSKQVAAVFSAYPIPARLTEAALIEWLELGQELEKEEGLETLAVAGETLLKTQAEIVRRHLERARTGRVLGYEVPVVNWGAHHSEVLAELLEQHPKAPFVAGYCDMASVRHWSLRTREDRGVNVAQLAATVGGGGHPLAAGFEEPLPPTSYGPAVVDPSAQPKKRRKSA